MAPEGISEYPAHDRLGHRTVDDISGFDCEAMAPAVRQDVAEVIQQRNLSSEHRWIRDRILALAEELREIPERHRMPEDYDAQKLLVEAGEKMGDATKRLEGNSNG